MDVEALLKEYGESVSRALDEFLDSLQERAECVHPSSEEALGLVRDFALRGGKRIRPVLMIFGHRYGGGTVNDAVVKASCSIELAHDFLLIHDDIIDRSELRRGGETVQARYRYSHEGKVRDATDFGHNMAILAGDITCLYAYLPLIRSEFSPERKLRALGILSEVLIDVCYGQILDTILPEPWLRGQATQDMVQNKVYHYKTARYSTEGPLHMGLALAGADKSLYKAISDYAIPAGIAFQIQDDDLGMFGTEEDIGKPVDSDLGEGKRTLLILKALELGNQRERETISRYLGKRGIMQEAVNEVREAIKASGAREWTRQLMEDLVLQAQRAIRAAPVDDEEAKEFLAEFAYYSVHREV